MFDNYIDNKKNEMIQHTQELIKIPSVHKDSNISNKPFGESVDKALTYTLNLGKTLGFRNKNIDGYCGYIEFGEGSDLIGIVGHLDVVPEGENWSIPPFSGKVIDNKIFGRGAIDDKGPVISALYAMKAVMDTTKVNKRVRLILGLNEERDWKCINYYKEHEEIPSVSFSPDADFPCIYAEKSIISSYLKMDYSSFLDKDIIITDINCNNNALNVVPKFCSVTLKINHEHIKIDDFISKIKSFIDSNNFEIDIYKIDYEEIKLTSYGIQAHAAHPDLGKNAISQLIIVLNMVFNFYGIPIEIFDFFEKYINTQYDGKNLNIDHKDESGELTLNVGKFVLEDSFIKIGMNIRIPIHTPVEKVKNAFLKYTSLYLNLSFDTPHYLPALYISKDNELIKTLCNIFNKKTNSSLEPIAIGGATYARAFKNCVSFGANLPEQKDMCHQTDEFISIDNLILASKIYAEAIYELSK